MIRLENWLKFFYRNTTKDIILTEEDEEKDRTKNSWFCEKVVHFLVKVRDHCHLTCESRDPAQEKFNKNVKQKSTFIPLAFLNSSNYDSHLFFEKIVHKKNDKIEAIVVPTADEDYISLSNESMRFIVSCRFLSSSLDNLTNSFFEINHESLKNFEE